LLLLHLLTDEDTEVQRVWVTAWVIQLGSERAGTEKPGFKDNEPWDFCALPPEDPRGHKGLRNVTETSSLV
jgi:hypothetical protein